jgi:hypothetical protein
MDTISTVIDGERLEAELGSPEAEEVVEASVNNAIADRETGEILEPAKTEEAAEALVMERRARMRNSQQWLQHTLDDKVFAEYTPEHHVAVKLTKGSEKIPLGSFGKLLSGEKLERGREVIITARYFTKDVHVPATTDEGSVVEGDGCVDLELINIRAIQVGQQLLYKRSPWKFCTCTVPTIPGDELAYPWAPLEYPLDGWAARHDCKHCAGKGYVRQSVKPGEEFGDD